MKQGQGYSEDPLAVCTGLPYCKGAFYGLHRGFIWDNGKEYGNYYLGFRV